MRIILAALGFVLLGLVILYCLTTQSFSIQEDIRNRVVSYFESESGELSDVNLSTDGRDVTLKGVVSSSEKRARLGQMASSVEGVRAVKNKILVDKSAKEQATESDDSKKDPTKASGILSIVKNALNKNIAKVKEKVNATEMVKTVTSKTATLEKAKEKVSLLSKKVDLVEIDTKSVRSCFQRFADTLSSGSIQFEEASLEINSKSSSLLDSLAETSQECKNTKIKIMGFANSSKNSSENKLASKKRAQAIASYLVSRGVVENRVKTIGFGRNRGAGDKEIEITIEENL